MLLFPKLGKRPKKKRKPPARRRTFKEHGANPLKTYRRKLTDYQVMIQAEACRQARLRDPTPQELEISHFLTQYGIKHDREKIWLNGDKWVLTDIYIDAVKLVIEID